MRRFTRSWPAVVSAALAAAAVGAPTTARADGPFGAGIILGEPSGLSLKLFLDGRHAVDAALDFSFVHDAVYVHADYLWHVSPMASRRGGRHLFLPYVGIGGKLTVHDDDDDGKKHDDDDDGRLGLRVPLGIAWLPAAVPIDVFIEVVPGLWLIPDTDPDLGAGIGIRYFF